MRTTTALTSLSGRHDYTLVEIVLGASDERTKRVQVDRANEGELSKTGQRVGQRGMNRSM